MVQVHDTSECYSGTWLRMSRHVDRLERVELDVAKVMTEAIRLM